MRSIAKKVKETLKDVKDKAVGTSEHTKEKVEDYTKQTESDPNREYESKEPMSPAKISEHEPTAVRRENTETSQPPTSVEDAKEKLRRSGMSEGTAGST
ncbi:MAG: hypothetical protein WA421_15550 [Nitrososphaeraceae archaeon]